MSYLYIIIFYYLILLLECDDLCDGCSISSNNCDKCLDLDKDLSQLCTVCRGTQELENNICVCKGNYYDDGTEICKICDY